MNPTTAMFVERALILQAWNANAHTSKMYEEEVMFGVAYTPKQLLMEDGISCRRK